jgi:hypothetical protein
MLTSQLLLNPSLPSSPEVQSGDYSQSEPSIEVPQEDSLVNRGTENLVYIGFGLLAITVLFVIGLLSRRLEYVLILAAILSIGLIGFFLLL